MMEELKPCPFFRDAVSSLKKSQFGFFVVSLKPEKDKLGFDQEYYRMPYFHDKEKAIAAWNTRADLTATPVPREVVEALEDAKEQIEEVYKTGSLDFSTKKIDKALALLKRETK